MYSQLGKNERFSFGNCKICGEKANGIHYGAISCQACKEFFKRNLIRNKGFRCYFGNECPINVKNRNICKSCRYNKCLLNGMDIQASRFGRISFSTKLSLHKKQISTLEIENCDAQIAKNPDYDDLRRKRKQSNDTDECVIDSTVNKSGLGNRNLLTEEMHDLFNIDCDI